jgi:hypothetical protein
MTLFELLSDHAEEILKDALRGFERSEVPLSPFRSDQARSRIKALYVLTTRAIKDRNLGPMLAHAQALGREHYASGSGLADVPVAFNVLEEVLWRRILEAIPPADYAEAFGLVGSVILAGKDALLRTYVTLASKTKSPSLDLTELFDGFERH